MASQRYLLPTATGEVRLLRSTDLNASREETTQFRPIRVLLVSDMLLTRAGLRHLLEAAGIALVGEASTCDEAVSVAKRERPEIILLDFDSRSDTFACLADLISVADTGRVITLSDATRAADHATLVEMGAAGLVRKDEHPDVLIKAIRKVHSGEIWLDRASTAQALRRMVRRRRTEDMEAARIATLTKREHEIIALVGEGLKNGAIAQRLFISEATVRNHLTSILDKLGLSDRFELAVYAFRQGLVRYPDQERPAKHLTKA
jgi:two-component system nitrate/nitrite response regulator NarL